MAGITLYNEQPLAATCVPNLFIDEYMTRANGDYVKIYLYLLRSINLLDCSFSLSRIADHFDCTERDILRALKYWEKKKLFRLEYEEGGSLSGICFLNDAHDDISAENDSPKDLADRFIAASRKREPDPDRMKEFTKQEDIRELIFITEQYLGRTLNQTDLSTIFSWYDELHFPEELIEFLIETCVSGGHTSLRYMQRVAEDYAAKGITSVEQARDYAGSSSALAHAVMKAFGIRGRNLVPSETDYIETWSARYAFSTEMISEACARTMNTIHEASFSYANSILERWYRAGIRTMEDVKKADEAHRASTRKTRHSQTIQAASRFANFQQRENDYEEIQNQLIRKSFQ
ncbi:MAG: DnaD domain protein [Clostridiales bacterium]|nr:DnaD domain protein [Clostridiales bacterium]